MTPQVSAIRPPANRKMKISLYVTVLPVGGSARGRLTAGTLVPGAYADLVAFRTDPVACPIDDLPDQAPILTGCWRQGRPRSRKPGEWGGCGGGIDGSFSKA